MSILCYKYIFNSNIDYAILTRKKYEFPMHDITKLLINNKTNSSCLLNSSSNIPKKANPQNDEMWNEHKSMTVCIGTCLKR